MTSYKIARRAFLRGCGGSAALLLPLLRSIEARAQGMAAPLRLLVIHHPLGAAPGLSTWRPNAGATTTTFTLPSESAPFAPLQSRMVMIDGLNLVTASRMAGNGGGQSTHEGGMVALMAPPSVEKRFDASVATWTPDDLAQTLGSYFEPRDPQQNFSCREVMELS